MMATRTTNPESVAANGAGPRSQRLNYKQWWLLSLVAVGGLASSFVLFWVLRHEERQMAGAQFRLGAEKKVVAIKQALASNLGIMSLFKAFYAGSMEVDRYEFKTFSDSIFEEHPDIRTLAWMPRVRREELGAFEEAAKQNGFPPYQITERRGDAFVPASSRKQYFPILFIEPQDKNQGMLGFDLGSIPECLAAMDLTEVKTGPAITYGNIPGLGNDSEFTVYMFDEAYNETPPSKRSAGHRPSADGFIMGVFHMRDVVNSALELIQPAGADIYFFDVTVPGTMKPIFSYPSRIRSAALPLLEAPLPESSAPIRYEERITVGDRTWLAYCLPTDVYFSDKSRWEPPAALLTGLLITGLLAGYLFLLTGHTTRVEKLVSQRTGELRTSEQRFRLLVENAADGFFLNDDNGNVLDVNQRACELLGYSREELLTMNVMDFEVAFKPEDHHERVWKQPASAYPVNVDGIHRRKDGSTFPVEVRLNCLETADKRFIMAISRDVTERKAAEAAIRKEQRFLRHLIDLQERDRKLMAYEIHDGLAQQLTGALLKLQSLETVPEIHDFPAARNMLDDVLGMIRESVDEARRLIGGLRPPILDESGIVAAIDYLCAERRQGGQLQIEFVPRVQFYRLSAPLEVALFRIVQECLTNASRHSQSPKIRVELSQLEDRIRLTVQDWGVGFDPQKVKGDRFGLRGIRERVRLLGGAADIDSAPGKGAIINVELPLLEGDIDEDDNNNA
jgi:PAS domain S-box-containing protein